ncbi:hypothetical protein DFJ73DRAFT_817072 [Zopfochytrium polystomum]|nr:hypothetical protein DFJ73DRAFT_817072 [Zopfochytrium polystomum]
MAGRPREEWDFCEELDNIESSCGDSVRNIVKSALVDVETEEELLQDIIDRSSGIPIAVNVILSTLKAQMNQGVKVSKLTLRDLRTSESAIDGLITAQLDSLSSGFRHIISVASVIGQYFTLETLCEVLQALEPKRTARSFERCWKEEDRFGFITKRAAAGDEYTFSHYLIHQGVLTAYLPQRREVVRRALVFLLIARLDKEEDDGLLLPTIIENLMQISGEEELKSQFLYRGFAEAAEARLSTDAFRYRRLLDELNPTYCDSLCLTTRLRDCRFRAVLHYQSGNTAGAIAAAAVLLKLAGCPLQFPTKTATAFFKSFGRSFSSFKALLASPPDEAYRVCAAFLIRNYPLAFSPAARQNRSDRRKVLPVEDVDEFLMRLDEIVITLDMLTEHFAIAGGLDYIILPMSILFIAHVGHHTAKDKNYWRWRLKQCYIQIGLTMFVIGMKNKSQACVTAYESYSSSVQSVREIECKALSILLLSFFRASVKETVLFQNTLLLRASLDCYRNAGMEFVTSAKASWLGFLGELVFLGAFLPKTELDGVFHVDIIVERARKFCVDRLFVQQLESAAAVQAALLSDYSKAEIIVRRWGLARFDRETLGLDHSQGSAQFSFIANVVCLSALLLERSVQPEMAELLDQSGREFTVCLKAAPSRLGPLFVPMCTVALVILIGLALSLSEETHLDKTQRPFLLKCSRETVLSIRKFATKTVPRHFLGKCCIKLTSIAESILVGATERCERRLEQFLRIRDDRFPAHLRLMLQARMLRLRRLRLGKNDVAPAVEVLLVEFQCVDNQHDPDRLKMLFDI